MSTKKGDKIAEKWDKPTVLEKLGCIFESAENTYAIRTALIANGLYHEWWSYITNKFKKDKDIFNTIKAIEDKIESNIIERTMSGDAKSTAMAIFLLKNKFGYKDKQEVDHTTKGEKLPAMTIGSTSIDI